MSKKQWTDEERKAFGEKMKAARLAKEKQAHEPTQPQENTQSQATPTTESAGTPQNAPSITLTQEQYDALMTRLNQVENNTATETVKPDSGFDNFGKPQGVIQRYSVDPNHYISPVERLMDLEELRRVAMRENYDLDWNVDQTVYETKYGTSFADPKFTLTLKKKIFEDGQLTSKRIIVQTGVFFEDPAASVKEAVALGIPITNANSPEFLEQMRFLRYKQWLLDIFNPQRPQTTKPRITPQVIDGRVYEIEDSSVVV